MYIIKYFQQKILKSLGCKCNSYTYRSNIFVRTSCVIYLILAHLNLTGNMHGFSIISYKQHSYIFLDLTQEIKTK